MYILDEHGYKKRIFICTLILYQNLWQFSFIFSLCSYSFCLYCFGFHVNIYISLYIFEGLISCLKVGCLNNIPHIKIRLMAKLNNLKLALWVSYGR